MPGWLRAASICAVFGICVPVCFAGSERFSTPKPEELSMTTFPGYPGVAGVVLYREQINKSQSVTVYERIKVLNEEGKKYASIELGYVQSSFWSGDPVYNSTVGEIVGRTIHADGTIVTFTGKPYEKTVVKFQGESVREKVFTLPDVQVGSILEFQYTKEFESLWVPDWIVQGELPVKEAHYHWEENPDMIGSTTTFRALPKDAKFVASKDWQEYDLSMKDIPPLPTEDYLPPSSTFTSRVMFNVVREKTADDYWKNTGHDWSVAENQFMSVNSTIKTAVSQLTAGSKTQDETLRKIYAKVMGLENTDYMRDREKHEDKVQGKREVKTASDVLFNQRGSGFQLARLFVTMARAAGMKAYLVRMPDRAEDVFMKEWLSVQQFHGLVALINVDGKDMFFDPGDADCPYGELRWQYTYGMGMRQTAGGDAAFMTTPAPTFSLNRVDRTGDLTMDAAGEGDGNVTVKFYGSPALAWRHTSRLGDQESFRKDLKTSLEDDLPNGFEVTVTDVKQLAEYELPLIVSYHIHGPLAAKAGKRMLVLADLFQSRETTRFNQPKREMPVYFHYTSWLADAVHITYPKNMSVENVPAKTVLALEQKAMYTFETSVEGNSFTTHREYANSMIMWPAEKYEAMRDFYQKFEAKDQESIVLKTGVVASAATPGKN
jgi:hypothetical protein